MVLHIPFCHFQAQNETAKSNPSLWMNGRKDHCLGETIFNTNSYIHSLHPSPHIGSFIIASHDERDSVLVNSWGIYAISGLLLASSTSHGEPGLTASLLEPSVQSCQADSHSPLDFAPAQSSKRQSPSVLKVDDMLPPLRVRPSKVLAQLL